MHHGNKSTELKLETHKYRKVSVLYKSRAFWNISQIRKGAVAVRHPERSIMRKKMEDKIIIGVKQEDLEESIAGLSQLLPVLLRNIAIGNK